MLKDAPIGILKHLYLPNGVPKVVNLLDSSSSLWLKNELVYTIDYFKDTVLHSIYVTHHQQVLNCALV